MGDVINLKRFKKREERDEAAKVAESNRARHGRTKSERAIEAESDKRANKLLDQHRINGEDA